MGGRHVARTDKEVRELVVGLQERGLLGRLSMLCKGYHVVLEDVLRGVASTRVVQARDACAHKLLELRLSTTETGKLLGMHHTSIMAASKRYKKRDMGRLLT